MSYRFKTEHYETVLKAGDMERCLPQLVWHLEDLRVGQSYPNYYVARLASKFVKVVLSGQRRRRAVRRLPVALLPGRRQRRLRALHREVLPLLAPADAEQIHAGVLPASRCGRGRATCGTIDVFRSTLPDRDRPPESPEEYVNYSLYFEAKTFLHGLLVVEDKLSMAHGLETRVPFLDNDLVDFAQRVPVRLKLRDLENVVKLNENEPGPKTSRYFEKTRDGKLLLRQRHGAVRAAGGHRAGEAGLLRARRELVPRREHRLRSSRASQQRRAPFMSSSSRKRCGGSCESTSKARRTGASCSGRC